MREFDYSNMPVDLLSHEIMNLLSAIHEYKGRQDLFIEAKPDILQSMLEIAKIQSTGSSNRIEGIYTSDERLVALVNSKSEPRNRSEQEIAGYREVLNLIHESYDFMVPRPNVILQLHRDLYHFRFQPLSAFETPEAVERLTNTFIEAVGVQKIDPLLLVPVFVLDFLCIHPFHDGNGRMSRLLTLLLLYRSGYIVGKYISVEMIIERTKETYYEVLRDSSTNWHDGKNTYFPFVRYYLEVILSAYKEFAARVEHVRDRSLSKPERIRRLFDQTLQKLSKRMILEKCPDISASTVEITLASLLKEGYIIKIGAGKSTEYVRSVDGPVEKK